MDNWVNLSVFFEYTTKTRKVINTTNAMEGMRRQIRKLTKRKAGQAGAELLRRPGATKTSVSGRPRSSQKMDHVNP